MWIYDLFHVKRDLIVAFFVLHVMIYTILFYNYMEDLQIEPKFDFILGAENMKHNTMLSSKQEGQLFKMHKYVVPSLDFQAKDGYLEDRWAKREQSGAGDYFIAYLHRNGKVESMVSGTIKGKDLYVINTATLPERRQKGYLKSVLCNLIIYLAENNSEIGDIFVSKSTRIPVTQYTEITEEVLQEINEQSNKIESVEDQKAQVYGDTIGRTVQAIKNHNKGKEFYDKITDKPPYNKFAVAKKLLDEASKVTKPRAKIQKGSSFNFTPYVEQDPELTSYSLKKVQQFDEKRRLSFEQKLRQEEEAKDRGCCGGGCQIS